jgi:uncharacterized protein YodC (DUF2158 family)
MNEFNVGDIVQIKGFSQKMTINEIFSSEHLVECVWFDSDGKFNRSKFSNEIIEKI